LRNLRCEQYNVPQVRRIESHERPGYVSAGLTNLAVLSSLTPKSAWYVIKLIGPYRELNAGS
jgi:hypothetical protein